MDILIRNLPQPVHAELTRRAAAQDKSLRAYVVEVLATHAATPSVSDWLEMVRTLPPAREEGKTGADYVDEARAEAEGG
jgi:plasmid stability protein